jgi:hypothetical protein
MFIDPTTEHEVETEINSLKRNKSLGYDALNAKVIQCVGNEGLYAPCKNSPTTSQTLIAFIGLCTV